jgi:hypothetical protein
MKGVPLWASDPFPHAIGHGPFRPTAQGGRAFNWDSERRDKHAAGANKAEGLPGSFGLTSCR